ncbi:hypothetical protein HJ526_12245 [Donghicola sp. C2-DW-16]|uniref:Uncharacterized protein n=1 Tax=Donghicola mangrovi TaxID=2729614 RepID=A0ABX2PFC6_9RHOB|nr:hypothetical protein [Donghicola mangrovi]NVO28196.1 hypothetical protein [Donghicola mangrovi]
MRTFVNSFGIAALCVFAQQGLAETGAQAATLSEMRQAVQIDVQSELPVPAAVPTITQTEGGAGLALPKGYDGQKLDADALAQAPAVAPAPEAEVTPAAVMPSCDDPRTAGVEEADGQHQLVISPICADQVRLTLTTREGAMVKPEFTVVDRTLRAAMPCGQTFSGLKMMVGFQPVSMALTPKSYPCTEAPVQAAQPVPAAPVASSGCGNSFDATVVDGILTATFAGCTAGEPVALEYQKAKFHTTAAQDGSAALQVPLLEATSLVKTADGTDHEVNWPEAARTIRVVLVWDEPIDLDLYVLEPGVSYNAFETAPHKDRTDAAFGEHGRMVVTSGADDATRFEVYDSLQSSGPQGLGTVVLSDVSRGMSPAGEFCGDGALAGPDFRVMLGGAEKPQKVRFAFEKAACGSTLDSGQYYRRVDDIHPFW